jgi:hypothetical protein
MNMITMVVALATALGANAAHPEDAPKGSRDTDPRDRVILVHCEPTNAAYVANSGDRFRGVTACAGELSSSG